jgi:hypothetical protein
MKLIEYSTKEQLGPNDKLIFTGDFVDRGPNAKEIYNKLKALKQRYKDRVVLHIGNHEHMNLKIINPEKAAKGEIPESWPADATPDLQNDWNGDWAKRSAYWGPSGELGGWLRSGDWNVITMHQIPGAPETRTVTVHAGLLLSVFAKYGGMGSEKNAGPNAIRELNKAGKKALKEDDMAHELFGGDGLLWTREHSRGADGPVCDEINKILTATGAHRMIVGHTPQAQGVVERCQGAYIIADTAMSLGFHGGKGSGPASAVVIETDESGKYKHTYAMSGTTNRSGDPFSYQLGQSKLMGDGRAA